MAVVFIWWISSFLIKVLLCKILLSLYILQVLLMCDTVQLPRLLTPSRNLITLSTLPVAPCKSSLWRTTHRPQLIQGKSRKTILVYRYVISQRSFSWTYFDDCFTCLIALCILAEQQFSFLKSFTKILIRTIKLDINIMESHL